MSSTRVMAPVELVPRELDLSAYGHDAFVDKLNIVPGLRTSTAFFTFLRANLVAVPSAASSPYLGPTPCHGFGPPSSSAPFIMVNRAAATGAAAGRRRSAVSELPVVPDDLPPLSVGALDSRHEKADALELVADSIAHQRRSASRYLALHPCLVAGLTACLAATQQFSRHRRLTTTLSLLAGVVALYIVGICIVTSRYAQIAKKLSWSWLRVSSGSAEDSGSSDEDDDIGYGEEDTVIGVRFGSEIIGALVLRLEGPNLASPSSPSATFGNHSRSASNSSLSSNHSGGGGATSHHSVSHSGSFGKRHRPRNNSVHLRRVGGNGSGFYAGKGVIRAWTIKTKYRNKGIGADLLTEAVRLTRERCGKDAAVGFARKHANSATLDLPEMFCGHIRRAEQKATKALDGVLREWEESKRRRKL